MQTARELLQFYFSQNNIEDFSKNIIPAPLNVLNQLRINKLREVTEQIGASSFVFSNMDLIPQIFRKFKFTPDRKNLAFGRKEYRTLSYSLSYSEHEHQSIFSNRYELRSALNLLDLEWKDSFLFGLIDCLLRNWGSKNINSLAELENFIIQKLNNYSGNRSSLIFYKKNKQFFNINDGDVRLGEEISKFNKPVHEAIRMLGFPETWLNYPYFSKVIVIYYEKNRSNILHMMDSINNVLLIHTLQITKKRLIPKIILQATEPNFISIKDIAKRNALMHLKDPQSSGESLWNETSDMSEDEISSLKKAKETLLHWIAEEFIDFFFRECINDPRRRNFWIKYCKQILMFKIVGSASVKKMLLSNRAINKYVPPRFASTNSNYDQNSALMFIIKDYLFIEFSDQGAFYAYKLTNPNAPSIESNSFPNTSALKDTSMTWLAYRTGRFIQQMNWEGKLGHTDGELDWEAVAAFWLKETANIYA